MNEKRKPKAQHLRKSGEDITHIEIINKVVADTQLRREDINETIKSLFKHWLIALESNKQIVIPDIGLLFPTIRMPRIGVALYGGKKAPKKIRVPGKWVVRFRPTNRLVIKIGKIKLTDEQLENAYVD